MNFEQDDIPDEENKEPIVTKFDEEFGMGIPVFYKGEDKQNESYEIEIQQTDVKEDIDVRLICSRKE